VNRIIAAAALAAAVLAIARWLDLRYARVPAEPRDPTESWENEGGAVSFPSWTRSSPVQR
jgi:hypothetical protein